MRFIHLLPVAALATSFVIPDEQTLYQLPIEEKRPISSTPDQVLADLDNAVHKVVKTSKDVFDDAIALAVETGTKARGHFRCYKSMTAFDAQSWLETATEGRSSNLPSLPEAGSLVDSFKHPHHPHKGHGPNLTVYELIAKSKYTTKLAALINDDEDLVALLNSTKANYTVFAPIDKAFEKIPKHKKIPKELIKRAILYHVSPEFYPAGRVLVSHTVPTALIEEQLGDKPQRLRFGLGFKGLEVNFYSAVVAINIFGTNGVIHGIDSILLPPPPTTKLLELLPGEFSTLELGLEKTGLAEGLKKAVHSGGTFFTPSNYAFKKLGPRINAFLFSSHGLKYLKALLEYHVVSNQTLYSDAYYSGKEESTTIPKGLFHVDLPTLLKDRSLSVDIFRFGGFISIKINGFTTVSVQDGIARDGVIHIVSDVLVPPKHVGAESSAGNEELTVEDLVERLAPFVGAEASGEEL